MTYSERDLLTVFFERITACLFDTSEKKKPAVPKNARAEVEDLWPSGNKGNPKLVAGGRRDAPSRRLHPAVDLRDAVSDRI